MGTENIQVTGNEIRWVAIWPRGARGNMEQGDTKLGKWHTVNRRLSDGVMVSCDPVWTTVDGESVPQYNWVRVSIAAPEGWYYYTGCLLVIDALVEIPYQIDRARHFRDAVAA